MDTTSIVFMSASIVLAVAAIIMATLIFISLKKKEKKAEAERIEASKKNHPAAKTRVSAPKAKELSPSNDINRTRPGLAMVREERRISDEQALQRIEPSSEDLTYIAPSRSLDRDLQVRLEEKERRLRREERELEELEERMRRRREEENHAIQYDSSAFPSNAVIAASLMSGYAAEPTGNYEDTSKQEDEKVYIPEETTSQPSTNDYTVDTSNDSPGGTSPSYGGSDYSSSSLSSSYDSSSSYSSSSDSSSSSSYDSGSSSSGGGDW